MTDSSAQPAIRPGYDVLAAGESGVSDQPFGDQFRVLNEVARVADNSWHKRLPVRQLVILPHMPLVLMAGIGGLDRIAFGVYREDVVENVPKRNVVFVRTVVATSAHMEAYSLGRDSSQRLIERLDAERRKLAIGRHVHLRMNLPGIGKIRVVNLKNHAAVGNGSVFFLSLIHI